MMAMVAEEMISSGKKYKINKVGSRKNEQHLGCGINVLGNYEHHKII
jgi:hypothetical protein